MCPHREGDTEEDVTRGDGASETAQYSILMSARDDKMDRAGDCCPHHQVHEAKGQPVSGSVDSLSLFFISPTCCLFISLAPLPPRPAALGSCDRFHARIPTVL